MENQDLWGLIISGIIAAVAAYASFRSLHKARLIEDTPTSKIRSAHQGYVEVIGMCQASDWPVQYSPLSHTECLWFRYSIQKHERHGKQSSWRTLESGSSEQPFMMADGSGECTVFPDRAEVKSHRKRSWSGNTRRPNDDVSLFSLGQRYRYSEEMLCAGDPIYVLGLFQTTHPASLGENTETEAARILADWKQDYAKLVAKFDDNSDGEIDLKEWQNVRAAALTQARTQLSSRPAAESMHSIGLMPHKKRPFIISTSEPKALTRSYRWQAFFLLALSLISLAAFIRLLQLSA